MLEHVVEMVGGYSLHFGYGFVFAALLLCGFGLPLPEDVVLVTGGVVAWRSADVESATATLPTMLHSHAFIGMVVVGLIGILAGDSVIFWAGRRFGARVADFKPLRRVITPDKLEKVEKLMRRRGNVVVLIARYLPGIRTPTYFTAGHAKLPYWEFLVLDGLAAVVSAPLWVGVGFYFGSNIEEAARTAQAFSHYILAAVGILVGVLALRSIRNHRARAREAAAQPQPPSVERE
jgi:membrane protein DedA with SNARE-associated domain